MIESRLAAIRAADPAPDCVRIVGKPEVIRMGPGSVPGSRLVGSDLRAWHRSRTDYRALGSNFVCVVGWVIGNRPLPYPVWLAPSCFQVYDVFSVESSRCAALVLKGSAPHPPTARTKLGGFMATATTAFEPTVKISATKLLITG